MHEIALFYYNGFKPFVITLAKFRVEILILNNIKHRKIL